jgi:predicted 2-oxoglutarate/Fe(II)-dependent dioxygenase YbiX
MTLTPDAQVYLAADFLDPATCRRVRAAMDRGTAEAAEVLRDGAAIDIQARRAAIIEIDPAALAVVEKRLDAASQAIADYFEISLETREGPGFLRYEPGGFYRRHRDVGVDADWRGAAHRLISLILFLNSSSEIPGREDFSGGELLIFPQAVRRPARDIRIVPRQGWLVAFHAAMLHEVQPVHAGTRDVVVDWYC